MYDIEKINKMMGDIEAYFSDIRIIGLSKENLNNPEKFYSSSMLIFGIINRAVDIAEEIIRKNPFGMPSSYEQYFELLGEKGVIDKNLSNEMKKLARDRNLFAHQYFDMNKKQVLAILKRTYYVKDFVERIKKVVAKGK